MEENLFNDRYQLRKELGQGQYGHVFLARDMHVGIGQERQKRRVAIKIVKENESDEDDQIENEVFEKLY